MKPPKRVWVAYCDNCGNTCWAADKKEDCIGECGFCNRPDPLARGCVYSGQKICLCRPVRYAKTED